MIASHFIFVFIGVVIFLWISSFNPIPEIQKHFGWIVFGVFIVASVSIYARSTRYVHVSHLYVLDKWTGRIDESNPYKREVEAQRILKQAEADAREAEIDALAAKHGLERVK